MSREDDADSPPRRMSGAITAARKLRPPGDDDAASKSPPSSDNNQDGASFDNLDPNPLSTGKRSNGRNCYRHTQHQIQALERLFKESPHPDEKVRLELSKDLNLDPRQVKFWFQNKRTQMKVHLSASQQLVQAIPPTCSILDRYTLPVVSSNIPYPGPSLAEIALHPLCLTDSEKLVVVELAVSAMEELAQIAHAGKSLWVVDQSSANEVLDMEEYQKQFKSVIGHLPAGLTVEATRETAIVTMDARSVIETLMDVDLWARMFSTIISKAQKVEILSRGPVDLFDGAMQVVYAELQLPTPFVPTREIFFLRYSKKVEHQWIVVDVCLDNLRANPPPSLLKCRKRPSGCVLEETSNGFAKVIWVEHVEVDNTGVHPIYKSLISSGMGFGAQLWVTILQRQCQQIANLLANNFGSTNTGEENSCAQNYVAMFPTFHEVGGFSFAVLSNDKGHHSMFKLAERMTNSFCAGVSSSSKNSWITLSGSGAEEYNVVIREIVDDPGQPPGVVLSAATSLQLPVSPARLFEFLCDHTRRTEWDILSNMGVVEELACILKGEDFGNSVSLLKVNSLSSSPNNSLILQDCCNDKSCSLVVYALVDEVAMKAVLNRSDPDVVTLLPSGFAIIPDRHRSFSSMDWHRNGSHPTTGQMVSQSEPLSFSLLTMAFQILVDHELSAKLSLESVATVNNLISSTVSRIKRALSCDEL